MRRHLFMVAIAVCLSALVFVGCPSSGTSSNPSGGSMMRGGTPSSSPSGGSMMGNGATSTT